MQKYLNPASQGPHPSFIYSVALRKQGVFKVASLFQALHNFRSQQEHDQIPNAVPAFGFFPPHPHRSWCILDLVVLITDVACSCRKGIPIRLLM